MDEYLDKTVGPSQPDAPRKGAKKTSAAGKTSKSASAKKVVAAGATKDAFYKGGKAPKAGEGQYVQPTPFDINSVLTNPAYYGQPLRVRLGVDYDF